MSEDALEHELEIIQSPDDPFFELWRRARSHSQQKQTREAMSSWRSADSIRAGRRRLFMAESI